MNDALVLKNNLTALRRENRVLRRHKGTRMLRALTKRSMKMKL